MGLIDILSILAIFFLLGVFFVFMYALLFGGPYAPAAHNRIATMIALTKPKKGEKMVDLGSGDGRIVIEFAKLGIESHGYEINPILVLWSKLKIRQAGVSHKAFIHFKDYWLLDFSKFNIVAFFVSPLVVGRVKNKVKKEMKSGSRAVSNSFKLPGLKHKKEENKVYLYEF